MPFANERDFADTPPFTGTGYSPTGSASILYGSDGSIIGMTIWNTSTGSISGEYNAVNITRTLSELEYFIISGLITGSSPEGIKVIGTINKGNYHYLQLSGAVLGSIDVSGPYLAKQFIFSPYSPNLFETTEFNPLIGNINELRLSTHIREVDKNVPYTDSNGISNPSLPGNYVPILNNSAVFASVQDSNYSISGWTNARYTGTELTNNGINGDEPTLNFRNFKGSIHLYNASDLEIKKTDLPDRKIENIYFTILTSRKYTSNGVDSLVTSSLGPGNIPITFPSGSLPSGSAYPQFLSYLYREEGNRLIKITTNKVYAIEQGTIFTLGEAGTIENFT